MLTTQIFWPQRRFGNFCWWYGHVGWWCTNQNLR